MDTSAVCVSHLASSSILFSPFSDQSHVDFYQQRGTFFPSLSLGSSPPRSLRSASSWIPSVSPVRALCDTACASPILEPAAEQTNLMMELAELKLQMKQKKKELKAQKKDEKKRLKMQVKEGRTMMKQKDATEGKKKKKCASESSSSSESSGGECESMSMQMLRQGPSLLCDGEGMVQKDVVERDVSLTARVHNNAIFSEGMCISNCTEAAMANEMETVSVSDCNDMLACEENGANFHAIDGSICRDKLVLNEMQRGGCSSSTMSVALNFLSVQPSNRIEVCSGGKCKKAGSEHLLSTLRTQIPSASNVEVVPCKCMGKCSMGMNVKVRKEDTNPQHHSHVRVEDANLILSHHFGFGCPPSGLPNLPSQDRLWVPLQMTTA